MQDWRLIVLAYFQWQSGLNVDFFDLLMSGSQV